MISGVGPARDRLRQRIDATSLATALICNESSAQQFVAANGFIPLVVSIQDAEAMLGRRLPGYLCTV